MNRRYAQVRWHLHCSVFVDAAVKARCSALWGMSSAIHAMVSRAMLPTIEGSMHSGARQESLKIGAIDTAD